MSDPNEAKRRAAHAALAFVPEHGVVGLGTGSTAKLFIDAVAELVKKGRKLVGVATSEQSRSQAQALGIPLLDDAGPWPIDVCVDGADEVSAALDLIKGGGGCQTREKIVNQASKFNVIVVDESKLSQRLGERWPVPIEVLAFGERSTAAALARVGEVKLRLKDGAPWRTDANNFIYDVAAGPIDAPDRLDRELRAIPGVVETGLFCDRADVVLVAAADGIRELRRSR
jgi:ribose 5-phosphate isomerase A